MTKILVLTRSYPSPGDLYKYPFVHRRALAYRDAGREVRVFRPDFASEPGSHMFDGVECTTGGAAAFEALAGQWRPDVIAVHGFSEQLWAVLERAASKVPVRAWLHGSEIPDFMRQKATVAPAGEREAALAQLELRCGFWNRFLGEMPARFGLVFVSNASVDLARKDWNGRLDDCLYSVIPNPVDTDLFGYFPKVPDDRHRVLLIRPFDSRTYANDLAVEAIVRLDRSHGSNPLRFTIIGDGPLFEETLEPLRGLASVTISRRFLRQEEIAKEHRKHGIFLVPTRLDTQGLSRDEAMASGVVPVTNAIPAVSEFVDESCAAIAPPDDPDALASHLWAMVEDPGLFLSRSAKAAERIRRERGNAVIIPRELELLDEAAHG